MGVRCKDAFVTEDDRIRVAAVENRDSIFAEPRMNEIIVIQEENVFAAGMFQTVVAGRANPLARDPMDLDRRMSASQRVDLRSIFCRRAIVDDDDLLYPMSL